MDPQGQDWAQYTEVVLSARVDQKEFLEPGWWVPPNNRLATNTTSRPSAKPGRKPAGLHHCDADSLERWRTDSHRYPPYQYKPEFCVHGPQAQVRVANIAERELIPGFPLGYTQHCLPKAEQVGAAYSDIRKTLLGNSWSVPVVACFIKQLFTPLGLMEPLCARHCG